MSAWPSFFEKRILLTKPFQASQSWLTSAVILLKQDLFTQWMDFRYDKIIYNTLYFLQKDDIMLHFTLSGSSDITGYQSLLSYLLSCLLFLFTWKVVGDLNLNLKVSLKFFLKTFFTWIVSGIIRWGQNLGSWRSHEVTTASLGLCPPWGSKTTFLNWTISFEFNHHEIRGWDKSFCSQIHGAR